jgi:hypothetical protein
MEKSTNKKKKETKEEVKETKKTTTKKTTSKKSTPKKTTTPKKRTSTKKAKGKKKLFTSDNILKVVFALLVILVIVLSVLVVNKNKNTKEEETANISVPIYETGTNNTISVNLKSLNEVSGKEYILKVTNYKDNKLNSDKISYTITITNNTETKISVTKNSDTKNLMVDNSESVIEASMLSNTEKEAVYYHIKITKAIDLEENDTIDIKIAS